MKKKHFIDLGKRIRKTRMTLGLKQKEMARVIGMKPSYLSSIESGKRTNPGIAAIFEISRHYQVSLDYLVHGIGDMFLPSLKNVDKTPQDFSPAFNTTDDVAWLMNNSSFAKNSILGYVVRFYIENEGFIKKEMMRSMGKGQEDAKDHGSADTEEKD